MVEAMLKPWTVLRGDQVLGKTQTWIQLSAETYIFIVSHPPTTQQSIYLFILQKPKVVSHWPKDSTGDMVILSTHLGMYVHRETPWRKG